MSWLKQHVRQVVFGALVALLNGGLAYCSVVMHPVAKGTAEEFWNMMYFLKGPRYIGGVYPCREGLCIYYLQGFHGEFIHAVPVAEVERLLPEVRRQALSEPRSLSTAEKELLTSDAGVERLVTARLAAERAETVIGASDVNGPRDESAEFELRWKRIRRYWLNILFEAGFLNGWLFLVAFPFLRRSSPDWSRAISAGLAFPMLFVPYFLGYCPWTFTSAGPSGGAVYPWMIWGFRWCSWGTTAFDGWLLKGSGFPLEPLTQPSGSLWTHSGRGGVAPTFAIVIGLLVGMGVSKLPQAIAAVRKTFVSQKRLSLL